jgi:hypothetical protein
MLVTKLLCLRRTLGRSRIDLLGAGPRSEFSPCLSEAFCSAPRPFAASQGGNPTSGQALALAPRLDWRQFNWDHLRLSGDIDL